MGGKDCVLLDFLKDEIKDNIFFFKKFAIRLEVYTNFGHKTFKVVFEL